MDRMLVTFTPDRLAWLARMNKEDPAAWLVRTSRYKQGMTLASGLKRRAAATAIAGVGTVIWTMGLLGTAGFCRGRPLSRVSMPQSDCTLGVGDDWVDLMPSPAPDARP